MFGRKKGFKDKVVDAKDLAKDTGKSAAKTIESSAGKVEKATGLALVLGALNWIAVSIFNFDLIRAIVGRKGVFGRIAYGFLGASAVYAAARGGSKR